jgi:hypothetical protein
VNARSLKRRSRSRKININHTQEGVSHGHQPGGQVEGEERDWRWRKDEKAKVMEEEAN